MKPLINKTRGFLAFIGVAPSYLISKNARFFLKHHTQNSNLFLHTTKCTGNAFHM